METTTPFDLNSAIQLWRENLGQSPAFQRENLDELEMHLRDSISTLRAQGLSAEEAFVIATGRIGKSNLLNAEFGKINGGAVWLDRVLWMLIGIQVWGAVSSFLTSISQSALSFGLIGGHFDFAAHGRIVPVVLFALVRLLAIAGSVAVCWWLIVSKGQNFGASIERFLHRRAMLIMICGILFVISLAGSVFGYGSQILLSKFVSIQTFGEMSVSMSYSQIFNWIIQAVTFIVLTLILACKRLRLNKTLSSRISGLLWRLKEASWICKKLV
jgi:hypothetical protein